MAPYLLSAGTEAYAKNVSVITPSTPPNGIITSYEWMLWTDIFVAAITENVTTRTVNFPQGNMWIDWWTNATYPGGGSVPYDVPIEKFPAFKRAGAIIPLQVTSDYSSHGDSSSSDALTVLLEHPASFPGDHAETKNVYEFGGPGLILSYNFTHATQKLEFRASAHKARKLLVLVRGVTVHDALRVAVNTADAGDFKEIVPVRDAQECRLALRDAARGWCRGDDVLGEMWIRPGDGSLGVFVEIFNLKGR
eukprot:Phypoly_transcript_07735.p2 GENE.Phypoly_transcript_07735~~Phypoly_transcript_07735.p2  ORF type:complete len:250 (+),score=54.22 Phypoly_transcript_07735:802-1551(+)